MEFPPRNGRFNKPTDELRNALTSYNESCVKYEQLASEVDVETLARNIRRDIDVWFNRGDWSETGHAIHLWVQDCLMLCIRQASWNRIVDALNGEKRIVDELDKLAYEVAKQGRDVGLLNIVTSDVASDTACMEFVQNQVLTWHQSPDARQHGSATSRLADYMFKQCLNAVDWNLVHESLRGE